MSKNVTEKEKKKTQTHTKAKCKINCQKAKLEKFNNRFSIKAY